MRENLRKYDIPKEKTGFKDYSDFLCEDYSPSLFNYAVNKNEDDSLNVLSLFSGCGGMDIGFEGGFICNKKSVPQNSGWIEKNIDENWVLLKKNRFNTIFANDILDEALLTWQNYMKRYGKDPSIYHTESIVDLVKMHHKGADIFPQNVDILTGGFPCQDFSVAGKRKGFRLICIS